ncbi:MAG: hypothetical protein J6I49_01710 [Bacteroidales bacterium]|nr:hypothetical protein [Bacteroidales bacterium]
MEPSEWLKKDYGLTVEAGASADGQALEAAVYKALVASGADYGEQKRILYECSERHFDLAFGQACLDRIEAIGRFEQRRLSLKPPRERRCDSGVRKNKVWENGAAFAELRFEAARPPEGHLMDAIEDMAERLVEMGYIEARPDVKADLRQGLGYYRPGEDLFRRRRTVKWLKGQNALHCWVAALLEEPGALCRAGNGPTGRWVTAASLFVDRHGKAFTYSRLEHGVMRDGNQLRLLRNTIPRRTSGS